MTEDSDALLEFITAVVAASMGVRGDVSTVIDEILTDAMTGDATAIATIDNPWNNSTPPSRKIRQIETALHVLRERAAKVGPEFLATVLEIRKLDQEREYYVTRSRPLVSSSGVEPYGNVKVGFGKLMHNLTVQANLTEYDCTRASIATITEAGRLIKRASEVRWCDEMVTVRELASAGVMALVCFNRGWGPAQGNMSAAAWQHAEERSVFPSHLFQSRLPVPVELDPPGSPRGWSMDSARPMLPALWDSFEAEPFYRSFVRVTDSSESISFENSGVWPNDSEPVPPYPTLEAMIRHDDDFRQSYRKAEKRFRVLDGHRAEHLERICALVDAPEGASARDQEVLDWAQPASGQIVPDMEMWDAWRPWGMLIAALSGYLRVDDVLERGNLVLAWAYLLKGRHLTSHEELPRFVRSALFDWLMLPTPSVKETAVRILVPRDVLPPVGLADESQPPEGSRAG